MSGYLVTELVGEESLNLLESLRVVRVQLCKSLLHASDAAAVDAGQHLHHPVEVVQVLQLLHHVDKFLQQSDPVGLVDLLHQLSCDPPRHLVELLDHLAA